MVLHTFSNHHRSHPTRRDDPNEAGQHNGCTNEMKWFCPRDNLANHGQTIYSCQRTSSCADRIADTDRDKMASPSKRPNKKAPDSELK
jgi:hypothetical protein